VRINREIDGRMYYVVIGRRPTERGIVGTTTTGGVFEGLPPGLRYEDVPVREGHRKGAWVIGLGRRFRVLLGRT
jgi:hypothetical protein